MSKAYYVNSVYANTVDVSASHLEHSKGERKRFKSAPPGLRAAHPGAASRAGVFTGRVRRPLRSPPNIHGYGRTRRKQSQLRKHRQGCNRARHNAFGAFLGSGGESSRTEGGANRGRYAIDEEPRQRRKTVRFVKGKTFSSTL